MEILDFAMEVDKKGEAFFRRLAAGAESAEVRRIFERMAETEDRLCAEHQAMKETGLDIASEALKDEEEVFRDHAGMRSADVREAIELARNVATGVCRLFREAAAHERNLVAGELLHQVADAECGELTALESVYDFINAPNEYLAWGEFSNLDEFHNFGRYEDNRSCRHTS